MSILQAYLSMVPDTAYNYGAPLYHVTPQSANCSNVVPQALHLLLGIFFSKRTKKIRSGHSLL